MAATAAALAAKGRTPKYPSNNRALFLFLSGLVLLAATVGYARWSAGKAISEGAIGSSSAASTSTKVSSKSSLQAEEVKKADILVEEKEKKLASEEAKKKEITPATKLKQPFATASDPAGGEKENSKKVREGKSEKKSSEGTKTQSPPANEASITSLVNALKKVANVNTNQIDIETDVSRRPYFAGHHVFAKVPIDKGSPVISLTGALQFSVRSVDKQLQKGLAVLVHHASTSLAVRDHLSNSPYYNITTLLPKLHDTDSLFNTAENTTALDETAPAPSSALDGDLHLLLLSMILEKRKEKKSIWWPWIESLPPIAHLAVNHGMFVTDDEFTRCLPHRGQRIVNDMRLEMRWIKNATAELCRARIPNLEPKLDAFRVQQEKVERKEEVKNFIKFSELERAAIMARYLVCEVSSAELEWAYAIITARSHLIGNVRTVFPLVDVLPYAVSATIKPGQIQASEEGKIIAVEFVAARDIEPDEPLSFRTSIREPIEAVIAQGFFDSDFFTDNNVPVGVFYHFDDDAKRFNPLDLGEDVAVHCGHSLAARSIPESGIIPREMVLCSELVFLKNVTKTADDDMDQLQALRNEHIRQFMLEKANSNETKAEADARLKSVDRTDGPLISAVVRQELRNKALSFILAALENTIRVFDTKETCAEDSRALLGEIQAHNDYVVSIVEKAKKALEN